MAATNAAKAAAAKKEVIADATEIVADVKDIVEDTIGLVKISWVRRNPELVLSGAILGAALLSSAATYLVVSKRLEKKWQAFAEEQIESIKNEYKILKKEGPEFDLEALAEKYNTESDTIDNGDGVLIPVAEGPPTRTNYNQIQANPKAVSELVEKVVSRPMPRVAAAVNETITSNVFDPHPASGNFDWSKERAYRDDNPEALHVITREEFDANESDFEQYHYTYYDGDGVLADSDDQIVHDSDDVVGDHNMGRFGDGSDDPEIVFVRNVKLQMDIEITRSDLSYSKAVLNVESDSELQHGSAQRRFRHPRDE